MHFSQHTHTAHYLAERRHIPSMDLKWISTPVLIQLKDLLMLEVARYMTVYYERLCMHTTGAHVNVCMCVCSVWGFWCLCSKNIQMSA